MKNPAIVGIKIGNIINQAKNLEKKNPKHVSSLFRAGDIEKKKFFFL